MKTINATCPECASDGFEIRLLKDESVGVVRCVACDRNYLLLDSEDYWFDVIQKGYPRVTRCSCKGTNFNLEFVYACHDDGDIEAVAIWSTCCFCGNRRRQLTVNIDYSPTQHLFLEPLKYCKTPRVFYDLKEITLYATKVDVARIADFLGTKGHCIFTCWLRERGEWVKRDLDLDCVKETIRYGDFPSQNDLFLRLYCWPQRSSMLESDLEGLKDENRFWKRNELIRISSPTHMRIGSVDALLYYLQFSNEYVENDQVILKSESFRKLTEELIEWLGIEFVAWRGKDCFDNRGEHIRVFGNRFISKNMTEIG